MYQLNALAHFSQLSVSLSLSPYAARHMLVPEIVQVILANTITNVLPCTILGRTDTCALVSYCAVPICGGARLAIEHLALVARTFSKVTKAHSIRYGSCV